MLKGGLMRLVASIFLALFALSVAAPAVAQRDIDSRLPLKTTADSDKAVPEWYQRFTFKDSIDTRPAWTGSENDRDVEMTFIESRRWKLRLGLTSRDGATGLPREEMTAGATFNITPRFSIGGALSLGAEDFTPTGSNKFNEQELETGIRLQSAFKF
ncbi:MAG: NtrZ family periplasmic regulatory protein [Pseudomonadota bacterium]